MTDVPRLAVIGMGRMGRAVAELARERGWHVAAVFGAADTAHGEGLTRERLAGAQVALEFSTADGAPANVRACVRAGCPVVVGTTGWEAERAAVEADVLRQGGALLFSPNFAIGVHLFWQIAELAARLTTAERGFDAHILETHHAAKRDAPSGTARELARLASAARGREIPVTSVRTGSVPGTHEIVFDAPFEQLRVIHEARDRRLFADGALRAARWLVGRQGVFTMRDFLLSEGLPA